MVGPVRRGHQLAAALLLAHRPAGGGWWGVENPPGPRGRKNKGPPRGQAAPPSCTLRGGHSRSWFFGSQAGPPQGTRGCQAHLLPRVIAPLASCNCYLLQCVIASPWEVPSCWNPAVGPEGRRARAGMWASLIPAPVRRLQLAPRGAGPPEPRRPVGLGALCSEGPLVPGSLRPGRPGCRGLKWYGCQGGRGCAWWGGGSFGGCSRSAAAAALDLILLEVDGKSQLTIFILVFAFSFILHWMGGRVCDFLSLFLSFSFFLFLSTPCREHSTVFCY